MNQHILSLLHEECSFEEIIRGSMPRWFLYAFGVMCLERVWERELIQGRELPTLVMEAWSVAQAIAEDRNATHSREHLMRALDLMEQSTRSPSGASMMVQQKVDSQNAVLRCGYWLMTQDPREAIEMTAWVAAEHAAYFTQYDEGIDPQQEERKLQRRMMIALLEEYQEQRSTLLGLFQRRMDNQEQSEEEWREKLEDVQF